MVQELLKDLILQHLGHLKRSRKEWLVRNCMMCHHQGESPDRRGRFGIMFSADGTIVIRCFNCKYSAKFIPGEPFSKKFQTFLLEIGIPAYDIKKLNFELYKEKSNLEVDPDIKLKRSITLKWVPAELPEDTLTINEWLNNGCEDRNLLKCVEYAYKRGFRNFNELMWTPDKTAMFNKRILLPFYYDKHIVGFTGRYFGTPPTKAVTKYHNTMPDDYIYNLDAQSYDRKYVIVTEGVFDAYYTDGISTSGNTINAEQIAIINSLGKDVIVCPDNDSAGENLVNIALEQKWAVAFPEWGAGVKDPSKSVEKYGRLLTVTSIVQSAETNPLTIQLKWKLAKRSRS